MAQYPRHFLTVIMTFSHLHIHDAFTLPYQTSSPLTHISAIRRQPSYRTSHHRRQTTTTNLFATNNISSQIPLNPTSFAGKIEQALTERFSPPADISRVIESWRNLDAGYEHRDYVGSSSSDPTTSHCHQHARSYIRGLTARTWWDHRQFDWCRSLSDDYAVIREEFLGVMGDDTDRLRREGNNVWATALTDDASSYGEGWNTLVLFDKGNWDRANMKIFPRTVEAIRKAGVPAVEVFFASMKPRTDIKRHSDFTNFVLTSHLALVIPESGGNKCRLSVGDDTREWIDGEVTLFDTSIMHDAINESDETRYILMFRVWHPELTPAEVEALQFIFDCLQIPDLVSDDPGERFLAEEMLKVVREFPEIEVTKDDVGGGGKKKKMNRRKGRRPKGFGA